MKAAPCKLLRSAYASAACNFLAPIAFHRCRRGLPLARFTRLVPLPLLRAGFFIGDQSMPRVPWPQFLHRQSQAHLVVGVVVQAEGPVGGDELNAVRNLLSRLVKQQKPGGDYAATVVRDTGRPEVYFAFVDEADARAFATVVQAETTNSYSGWASHRAFDLPGTKLASLEASLPPPRDRSRQRDADAPRLARRVRHGPLMPSKRYDEE